ncbi:MAG: PHB depolymerase family esterase [Acidobacteriota bacterium]|nr:PHB depolymerase family esterase [Acidobacteriota bacterium]
MSNEQLTEAVSDQLRDLLATLEGFDWVGRRLQPAGIGHLVDSLRPMQAPLAESSARLAALGWPEHLAEDGARLERAGHIVLQALESFLGGGDGSATMFDGSGMLQYYRALRCRVGAFEELYPLANVLVPVGRYFLEAAARDSNLLLQRLAAGPEDPATHVGFVDVDNGRGTRGGFTLYVPEYYTAERSWPLVVALHGGSGHGADFVWSWLGEARSRGMIVLSPTAQGDTWSMFSPSLDGGAIEAMVENVSRRWSVDAERILLTGMSDGGTFSLIAGFHETSPFTHLAPMCGVLPPLSVEARERVAGLPIYLVHGTLDWMFPAEVARMANDELSRLGAAITYREIADLSHTYPREENAAIADWFGVPLDLPVEGDDEPV